MRRALVDINDNDMPALRGNPSHDTQSGAGVAQYTHVFSRPQKTVVRAPFKTWPKPIWSNSRARAYADVARRVAGYELDPSWLKLLGMAAAGLRPWALCRLSVLMSGSASWCNF